MTTEYPKKAVHATVATNPKIMTANAEMRTACCQPRRKSEDGFGIATSTGAGAITTAVFADIVIQSIAASLPHTSRRQAAEPAPIASSSLYKIAHSDAAN